VDGVSVGAVTSYTFHDVRANHSIAASFAVDFTITASAGTGGTIAPNGAVAVNGCGASQGFTITPGLSPGGLASRPDRAPGGGGCNYRIVDVRVDGVSVGAVTSYRFKDIRADHTIAASFAIDYTITASAGTGGTIVPNGAVAVNGCGASQGFTIIPGPSPPGLVTPDGEPRGGGCGVADVLVDGVSVGAVTSYVFKDVRADHTIVASFVGCADQDGTSRSPENPLGSMQDIAPILAWPNPFASTTSVRFSLAEPSEVDVRVMDMAGRQIRTIHSGRMEAGRRQVVWDGLNSSALPAKMGIYFVQVQAGERILSTKVVRMK
jgi:hypothetical protein